jgi:hypothetical protein
MNIRASIFEINGQRDSETRKETWSRLVKDIERFLPDKYEASLVDNFKIILKLEKTISPTKALVRLRTINASIRIKLGKPSLLDVSVANHFASPQDPLKPAMKEDFPKETIWWNRVEKISLMQHVTAINEFITDARLSGWELNPAQCTFHKLTDAVIKNGLGCSNFGDIKTHQLLKNPYKNLSSDIDFLVGSKDIEKARIFAEGLQRSVHGLLYGGECRIPIVSYSNRLSANAVNLWILEDSCDLNQEQELRFRMGQAEERGLKFKLSKFRSVSDNYALRNIAYDMLLIGGMVPYVLCNSPNFCSADAGHSHRSDRSRWVCTEIDASNGFMQVDVVETFLAEHLPTDLHDRIWPRSSGAVFCRDGRFSKEERIYKERALKEGRDLIQCKKSPRAVMWCRTETGYTPCTPGSCVIDPHGEILLQTMAPKANSYVRPLRLTIYGKDKIKTATDFFQHGAIPGISLTNSTRLPGSLYYADVISKLTTSGWTKVIGRGWGLSKIVPE